jgi:1,2-phenylacetyl-CoA epoxidase catalytic subunit
MANDATKVFESTDGMTELCRGGLRHLLIACADTKLLLGYHYGEWTFGAPALEAAVAHCSLAQAELGHVRLLHGVLERHCGDDPDQLIEGREAHEFANVTWLDRPLEDWCGVVVMNAVVDLAMTRLLDAMQGSAFLPVRHGLDKMLDEERHHVHHGFGWLRTLARRDSAECERIERHLAAALTSVAEWFGPAGEAEDGALLDVGVKERPNPGLFALLLDDIRRETEPLGLDVSVPDPSFEGWTPERRRSRAGGIDPEILFHLRGGGNEAFKLH